MSEVRKEVLIAWRNLVRLPLPNRSGGGSLLKRIAILAALAVTFSVPVTARETDAQIRQKIIQESIDSYPGNCPCPYNTDRAGHRCGGRSAYNRAGGYSPKCFTSDVSDAEVRKYRASH